MNSQVALYVAQDPLDNSTLVQGTFVIAKCQALGWSVSLWANPEGEGSGQNIAVADLIALGLDQVDDAVNFGYQIAGQTTLHNVAQTLKAFFGQGYTGFANWMKDAGIATPDPTLIPGVSSLIQSFMSATITPVPTPTPAPSFVLAGPVSNLGAQFGNALKCAVVINGQAASNIAIRPGLPPTAYNDAGNDITASLVSQGVNVQALLSTMQAALPPGS